MLDVEQHCREVRALIKFACRPKSVRVVKRGPRRCYHTDKSMTSRPEYQKLRYELGATEAHRIMTEHDAVMRRRAA